MGKKGQVKPCSRRHMSWAQTPGPGQGSLEPEWGLPSLPLGLLGSQLILSQGTLKGGKNSVFKHAMPAGPCARGLCLGWRGGDRDTVLDEVPAWECPVYWAPEPVCFVAPLASIWSPGSLPRARALSQARLCIRLGGWATHHSLIPGICSLGGWRGRPQDHTANWRQVRVDSCR